MSPMTLSASARPLVACQSKNFHEGLKNAQQRLSLFDNITFIDGNSEYGQIIALHISKSHTHKVVDNPPLWFREQFEDCFSTL